MKKERRFRDAESSLPSPNPASSPNSRAPRRQVPPETTWSPSCASCFQRPSCSSWPFCCFSCTAAARPPGPRGRFSAPTPRSAPPQGRPRTPCQASPGAASRPSPTPRCPGTRPSPPRACPPPTRRPPGIAPGRRLWMRARPGQRAPPPGGANRNCCLGPFGAQRAAPPGRAGPPDLRAALRPRPCDPWLMPLQGRELDRRQSG